MKIKIKRVTKDKYNKTKADLGPNAEIVMVPATVPGVMFQGIQTSRTEVMVAWPIDRPPEHQIIFANENTFGGQPVEEMEKEINRNGLQLIHGTTNEVAT